MGIRRGRQLLLADDRWSEPRGPCNTAAELPEPLTPAPGDRLLSSEHPTLRDAVAPTLETRFHLLGRSDTCAPEREGARVKELATEGRRTERGTHEPVPCLTGNNRSC
jgi:hypothetical protein